MKEKILPLLFLLSLLFNILFVGKELSDQTVEKILDGDTFILNNGERIRLLGIDAPEKTRCGATEATEALSKLILGKPVRITESRRDEYGRKMGLVYFGTILINESMLYSGWARPDYSKNSQTERLKAAYRATSEDNRGINSTQCKKTTQKPPNPTCVIKGNIDQGTWDHFYHLPTCRHYNQIVLNLDSGENYFCSQKEAQDAGFKLAPDCLR